MEDAFDRQLIVQEQSLRMAMLVFSHTRARLPCVAPGAEWVGPASTAYQAAVDDLRAELAVVDDRLDAALQYTRQAIATRERP